MIHRLTLSLAAALAAATLQPPPAASQGFSVAVFDFELIDTSQEGEAGGVRGDQERRLGLIGARLREMMAERGLKIIDVEPARARIAKAPIRSCNGCEAGIARGLGAETAATGTVQKISNLILNINLTLRDAVTGAVLRAGSVDIRGNTDDSWLRGLSYLVRNRLFDPPLPALERRDAKQ